ncbi:MAG: hypothetical protein KA957_05810 [Syntrophaceae bacterium]|nr:hypothetical protein [Syntrophaceae bacterium]
MNLIYQSATDIWKRIKRLFAQKGFREKTIRAETPLRAELLSAEQMKQHGMKLAATHQLSNTKAEERLLGRLHDNEEIVVETIKKLTTVVSESRSIAPAEEWLLDNFYLIEENIRTAKRHLSRGYSRGLPWLTQGDAAGLPRVYDLAQEIISHGDGRVDLENLVSFITAYQSASYLKLGELWAIPIMLRLALIENIRRISTRIMVDIADRAYATTWANQMLDIAKRDPKNLVLSIADMARSDPSLSNAFVAEFARRLHGSNPSLALPLSWVDQRLSESHLTIEQLIHADNQQQAADQASVSNSIGALRFLTTMDWCEFVETLSVVEKVLREDPADVYIRMDFVTRDHYRHVVERIAKHSPIFERDVARIAVDLAAAARAQNAADERMHHVGYYLIDKGLGQLEKNAKMRLPLFEFFKRTLCRVPLLLYLGGVMLITLCLSGILISKLHDDGFPLWFLTAMAPVLLLCASSLGVALTHWIATLLARPRLLPRMDFSLEIPPESSTLVVIPSMLSDEKSVERLIESLEIRFLTNRDNNLHFGLLTDFTDAESEHMPQDEALLRVVEKGIKDLHDKYRGAKGGMFFLFHRPRRWNPHDRIWMGYERKRGKLADLNALLRGGAKDAFSRLVGATEMLSNVKYIITLDTDTQLPREAAQKFIGTLSHPLNRPRFDASRKIITEGYGILQPRLNESLSGMRQTRYSRLWGGQTGIDPYTRMVSDVYQDVFGEGSFVGKGIYDIDAFEKALHLRLPENRILSHDLIEGCHARAGLISDVELYEEYPAQFRTDVSRRHRWIRGDWQIAGWLRSTVPSFDRSVVKNELSRLSQWKIFDNLRRSLLPAALTILLVAGWTVLSPPWFWTLLVAGILLLPSALAVLLEMFRKPGEVLWKDHVNSVLHQAGRQGLQILFTLTCLPYEAFYSLDAVLRTVWRMIVTHKRLLEWNPFTNHRHHAKNDFADTCRSMWIGPVLALAVTVYLACLRPSALWMAIPLLFCWLVSPAIVWWLGRPGVKEDIQIREEQAAFLRQVARRTWAFFESFVTVQDNWLPPDNYQEHPGSVIAHRTSPTNMGLALLANLSAFDFGFITQGELIRRTANTFCTMEKLERHRGHFYNWYDTLTLKTLPPHYISTVDSGNLCGHLLTLKWGLLDLPENPIWMDRNLTGLSDTCRILSDTLQSPDLPKLDDFTNRLDAFCHSKQPTMTDVVAKLDALAGLAAEIVVALEEPPDPPALFWAKALERQCRDTASELAALCPWAAKDDPSAEVAGIIEAIGIPTLRDIADAFSCRFAGADQKSSKDIDSDEQVWIDTFHKQAIEGSHLARERLSVIPYLISKTETFAEMDYSFLYDQGRQLLTIGYSVGERRRDGSFYDLLASEARLSSFVAIAKGQLPQDNWFALGRMLTNPGGEPVLLAWDGSMFEYLMPLLVMPNYENTLLDQTYRASVRRQIDYGNKRGVPWGVSESGYNLVDVHLNYQYRAFGVPGLGLKRGLADDLVVAPYATALALMVMPQEACLNLQRLDTEGMLGEYGFYEAMDFTPARLPGGQNRVIVRSYMAHHQGMTLLSIAHLLLNQPMQQRFASEPMFQSAALLLQERIPKAVSYYRQITDDLSLQKATDPQKTPPRTFKAPDIDAPEVQLLSNGRYHVMVSVAGGGYSRWTDLAVTRWREDATRDCWGIFCYIRDTETGEFWSNAHQPALQEPDRYEAIFSDAKVEFRRRDHDINTYTQIAVSPEDDIEIRRIRITNRSRKRRVLDLTSYAEIVIAPPAADEIHPAFSNLFVQTEILSARQAIVCTRRPRSKDEPTYWGFHLMTRHGHSAPEVSYETDRLRFIGRGNTPCSPQVMRSESQALSNTDGSVLDPIVAVRHAITLAPGESATLDMVTGITKTREQALTLVKKYADRRLADRVFNLAWTHSQVALRQINITEAEAQLYAKMAGPVIYAGSRLRADPKILIKNRRGQSGLWGYAISGDLPIVLLQIADHANIDLVRQLQQAHAYWRLKGLAVDLVIWNEDDATYRQTLHDQIMGLIATGMETRVMDRPGGIFVRQGDQISFEDRILLQTVARVIIKDSLGTLEAQIKGPAGAQAPIIPGLKPVANRSESGGSGKRLSVPERIFDNGLGGFTPDGREYVIVTDSETKTPLPWANILANPHFGSIVSERGSAATWSENAHEYRLTPWLNDPVCDQNGEALYLRDEQTGHVWSPCPHPCPGETPYVCHHGFGYSVFEHEQDGIQSELKIFVSISVPVKFMVLTLRNASARRRELSATGYLEWVLGDLRTKTMMHVTTEVDVVCGALFARNPYNTDFADRVAFFDVDDAERTFTGDREDFLGRNGELSSPAALKRSHLSGKVGAGLDPCAALQVKFGLDAGQTHEVVFRLGVTGRRGADDASRTVLGLRGKEQAESQFNAVRTHWEKTLSAVQIETPDASVNVLANGWLVYQTLACRLWARNGYYQSGGAFGFRDQLQDSMALVHAKPDLVREHLLLCASRQFTDGDAQHWWHPPTGRGVRTQCSDDFLWLPLAVSRYITCTGDFAILDETAAFLEGRQVRADEDSYYDLPTRSDEKSTLYDHCVRAIRRGLRFGSHGLPLMGGGDWNDGMNKVGEQGIGESVWMGFFLYEVLGRFAEIARVHGDTSFAEFCLNHAVHVQRNIEKSGWDGRWYSRAYCDDGSVLGSCRNMECRIDSIAQSWSVLSGAGQPKRARLAMDALDEFLVNREQKLVQLLDPPFDKSEMEPGYIKGYVPGVRENGGQYTHAAIWASMAFAALGDRKRAWEVLNIINPIHHARTPADVDIYKVEPYVVAADVYAVFPHVGRGGWTWLSGSAAWLYRLIVESLLGLTLQNDSLSFSSCLPADWKEVKITYRHQETIYRIMIHQTVGEKDATSLTLDGVMMPDGAIKLINDQQEHAVVIEQIIKVEQIHGEAASD